MRQLDPRGALYQVAVIFLRVDCFLTILPLLTAPGRNAETPIETDQSQEYDCIRQHKS